MKIENSLEWNSVRSELTSRIEKLSYDPAIRRMVKNIDSMVSELSKIEVEARRTRVPYYKDDQLSKINTALEDINKIIFIAILYG